MLNYELKKLFAKRINVIFLVLLLAAAVIFNLLAAKSVLYFDSHGAEDQSLKAVRMLTEEKNKWKGSSQLPISWKC